MIDLLAAAVLTRRGEGCIAADLSWN